MSSVQLPVDGGHELLLTATLRQFLLVGLEPQVVFQDDVAQRQQHRPPDAIFQFSHIAGPGMAFQLLHSRHRQRSEWVSGTRR